MVPGGRPLHEYVNLYFCARNPMLFRIKDLHLELCVLQIDTNVLDLPGVVITGGYVSCQEVCRPIEDMAIPLEMTIHTHLFFS